MKTYLHISAMLLIWGATASCSDSLTSPIPSGEEDGEISITLRIPVADGRALTRANPVGGEDGNGREAGMTNENEIYDANIFFFKGSGLNPAGNTSSIEVADVFVNDIAKFREDQDNPPFEKKITITVKSADTDLQKKKMLDGADISFITVLNAGRDLSDEIENLNDLRSFVNFDNTWTPSGNRDASKNSRFVMTTAYDAANNGTITIDGKSCYMGSNRLIINTGTDALAGNVWEGKKWIGETTVQRMCARIDLMYTERNKAEGELVYEVPVSKNKVHLRNILPVNIMQKPSFLLSKITTSLPTVWSAAEDCLGDVIWGGVEATDGYSIPSNYVIEPRTLQKVGMTTVPADWYGSTSATNVLSDIANPANGAFSEYFSTTLRNPETDFGSCDRITVIGYANENIESPDCYNSKFITGVAFRALFQPRVWSSWNETENTLTSTPKSDEEWEAMSDKTFWRYTPSDGQQQSGKDADAIYFASGTEASRYAAAHPADNGSITKFDGGICYYNSWLRHFNIDNADPQKDYPMEYTIVRNNIYRCSLAFSGPGDPVPTMREPDTMMSRIFVRKWNQREEKSPLTF